ncbi:glycosyltransferase family 4 protein [Psychrosphaera sp. F3M07]|uniref:glycosyltransferase family 4 protein n=1 Tax=Psychrosphaera sp. F3M07 TaxID=2841560 RepID=UPI001C08082E|nr:glycosyltransferase family 4 protein [Psychrosphaera sp. F3M07]MBU2917738.1 glycosyltransferase family 4 protein [Psychrosphaera sp. F3M07]
MNKKILLIGPLPPPHHGQSLSFKMLTDSIKKDFNNKDISVIDISDSDIVGRRGFIKVLIRSLKYVKVLIKLFGMLTWNKTRVYLTISQSKQGFLRDFFIIWISFLFKSDMILHLKGGNYGHFYQGQNSLFKYLIRKTLLRSERILVLGKNLVKMYDFEPKLHSRIHIVENGLPFSAKPKKNKVFIENNSIELLFLSNLVESKGYLDVLESVAKLKHKGIKVRCHFAGSFYTNEDDINVKTLNGAKELFFSTIRKLGIDEHVIYHGVVSGDVKLNLLSNSHIFILPTNYNNEGQPVSIIEALSFGLPIVTTNYRAISDMVHDKVTGAFVDYNNPESITQAIEYIYSADNYEVMSKECYKLFDKKFTTEAHLSRIYPHILGENKCF